MKEYTVEQLAYLAGILDGEGCLKPSRLPNKKTGEYIYKVARVEVSNTSKELIDWLYGTFGGHVCPMIEREGNRKPQYRWKLRKQEMKDILPLVIPYFQIKKKEAEDILDLFKH